MDTQTRRAERLGLAQLIWTTRIDIQAKSEFSTYLDLPGKNPNFQLTRIFQAKNRNFHLIWIFHEKIRIFNSAGFSRQNPNFQSTWIFQAKIRIFNSPGFSMHKSEFSTYLDFPGKNHEFSITQPGFQLYKALHTETLNREYYIANSTQIILNRDFTYTHRALYIV